MYVHTCVAIYDCNRIRPIYIPICSYSYMAEVIYAADILIYARTHIWLN